MSKNLILFLLLIVVSCSGSRNQEQHTEKAPTDCIDEENQDVVISWGVRITEENLMRGYKLLTSGEVYRFTSNDTNEIRINNIQESLLCLIHRKTTNEFVKVGALNVPADTTLFVIYDHPAKNLTLRAQWNPKTPAIGSKGFRKIWDLLERTYPSNRILLHKEDQ